MSDDIKNEMARVDRHYRGDFNKAAQDFLKKPADQRQRVLEDLEHGLSTAEFSTAREAMSVQRYRRAFADADARARKVGR
jgi:FixJ family two-component response regulator